MSEVSYPIEVAAAFGEKINRLALVETVLRDLLDTVEHLWGPSGYGIMIDLLKERSLVPKDDLLDILSKARG